MSKEEYSPKGFVGKPVKKILQYRTVNMVGYCRKTIEEYSLDILLKEPEELIFEKCSDDEKEKLCAGIIKLGEALTYCRDSVEDDVTNTGISELATNYVKVRNHFVHYQLYYNDSKEYGKLNRYIRSVGSIESLKKSLASLENCGVEVLSKEWGTGTNKFAFGNPHFVKSLKNESSLLRKKLNELKGQEKIPFENKIFLENRVRNILVILLDLLQEEIKNSDEQDEKFVSNLNRKFKSEDKTYEDLFKKLQGYRNSLCHLEADEAKPYEDEKQLLEFSEKLDGILQKGYIEALEKKFLIAPIEAPRVEILEYVVPSQKKPQKMAIPSVVVVVPKKQQKGGGLGLLSASYGTLQARNKPLEQKAQEIEEPIAEPEKKKEKIESLASSPRMGGKK